MIRLTTEITEDMEKKSFVLCALCGEKFLKEPISCFLQKHRKAEQTAFYEIINLQPSTFNL